MENMQKALIMAGSVFMFVIAVSVGIYSYNVVMEINDSILTSSANNNQTAEYFTATTENVDRYATRDEIIMAIYSLADKDFVADVIEIKGQRIFARSTASEEGNLSGIDELTNDGRHTGNTEKNISDIKEGKYKISYSYENYTHEGSKDSQKLTVIYELVSDMLFE